MNQAGCEHERLPVVQCAYDGSAHDDAHDDAHEVRGCREDACVRVGMTNKMRGRWACVCLCTRALVCVCVCVFARAHVRVRVRVHVREVVGCDPFNTRAYAWHSRLSSIRPRAPNSTMQYSTVSLPMQAPITTTMPYSTASYPVSAPIAYSAGVSAPAYNTVSVPIGATMQVGIGGAALPAPAPPIMCPDPVRSSTRVMLSRTRVLAACVSEGGDNESRRQSSLKFGHLQ